MANTSDTDLPCRRDFIVQAAGAFVAVGSAAALWPFIHQMNPNDASPPLPVVDVDLLPIQPGQMITVAWRGQPIFIRHRTPEEVQLARSPPLSDLPDPYARNASVPQRSPAADANRTQAGHENWLIVIGICTHLGCRLLPQQPAQTTATGEGWFCPCHAARFDLAGRVRSGPARTNLPVPPYQFVTPTRVTIG